MMKRTFFRIRLVLYWPFLYVYFHGSTRSRVLVRCQGSVLLVQDRWTLWFDDQGYTVPGGGVAKHEQPLTGAIRELQEELGIRADASNFVSIGEADVSQHGIGYHAYFFILDVVTRPEIVLQHTELASARWFSTTELADVQLKQEGIRALELAAKR